jgi:hypothetical protein
VREQTDSAALRVKGLALIQWFYVRFFTER